MICPKCANASLVEIVVKASGRNAYMCDHCDTVWFVGEQLTAHTGIPFEQVTRKFTLRKRKKFPHWLKKHTFFCHVTLTEH